MNYLLKLDKPFFLFKYILNCYYFFIQRIVLNINALYSGTVGTAYIINI